MEGAERINDACRLCDENKDKMHSIFEKTTEGQQILHLIKECLPLIIFRTDPLSKKVCKDCFSSIEQFYKLKKVALKISEKHKQHLQNSDGLNSKSVQLYLACANSEVNDVINSNIPNRNTSTSTEDLKFSCINCSSNVSNNEIELCAELHKAIADSLSNNQVITSDEKSARTRRRRSQAFYHELDDSLCSSLTEYTNTEGSQGFDEYHSEVEDSYGSDSENMNKPKRRKLNPPEDCNGRQEKFVSKQVHDIMTIGQKYKDQVEYRYIPLSLMTLALNVINEKIVPGYEPDDYYMKIIQPQCRYCKKCFQNSKLLSLHEVEHINIELGEKVDNPIPWHESRDDSYVRNKWLSSFDDIEEQPREEDEDDDDDHVDVETSGGESLLIPVGTEIPQEHQTAGEIVLIMAKPTVNGICLSEYTKDERKSFYKTMKVGNVNKKFCSLCRYSFKDNWAIESHYFSLACYYTCRYCGMRFNKQRHRFDDHVHEHEKNGDPLSTKIYTASKLNNFVPKIVSCEKVNVKIIQQSESEIMRTPQIKVKSLPRQSYTANIKIKQEKVEPDEVKPSPSQRGRPQPSSVQSKPSNQAYFCRKCYKVFFKLDEFNIHSKNCDYNSQFPGGRPSGFSSKNGEMLSPSGRPMRHCVKEVSTYRDEAYIPEKPVKEPPSNQQSFVCFICNTPFPTIYSRNSHMRIHKGETPPIQHKSPANTPKFRQQALNNSFPGFIKQEPLEPEIQIHESEQNYNSNSTSIGSVSITPISKNPNQKATINPNIMKLVQNNPHLTIRANRSPERQPAPSASAAMNNYGDSDKSYKCSSCWEAFSNKSHLYFHKKNQCEGSKYPCPFCKKRFGTEAAYSSHIFYSHPE